VHLPATEDVNFLDPEVNGEIEICISIEFVSYDGQARSHISTPRAPGKQIKN